ncbi:MAG: FMN-binding protein [Planctomycetota bacterium]
MPDGVKFPLILAVIAAIAGGGLAFVQVGTAERIEENRKRKLNAAFGEIPGYHGNQPVTPAKDRKKEIEKKYGDAKCFRLLGEGGKFIGYAAQVSCTDPACYNGTDPIVLVVAVDAKIEKVLVVRTTKNAETPGLGTKVSRQKPAQALIGEQPRPEDPQYPFLDMFSGRPTNRLDSYEKGNEKFDAETGATISSNAVLGGVRKAVALIRELTAGQ